MYRRWGGYLMVAGIRDHSNGVAPWGKHERFREYPLTRLRGYGGHRVYVPFSSSLLDGALHASLGDNQCLVVGPEHLPNTPTLIGESDLDIDFWMRDSNAIGRGHK